MDLAISWLCAAKKRRNEGKNGKPKENTTKQNAAGKGNMEAGKEEAEMEGKAVETH